MREELLKNKYVARLSEDKVAKMSDANLRMYIADMEEIEHDEAMANYWREQFERRDHEG